MISTINLINTMDATNTCVRRENDVGAMKTNLQRLN